MTNKIRLAIVLLVIFALSAELPASGSLAQIKTIIWDKPINLSDSDTSSTYPSLIADSEGHVHLFWGEDLGGKPVNPTSPAEPSNAIMYSMWDGTQWSVPIDLFIGEGKGYGHPYAALDGHGYLHLVWRGLQGIYYSKAPVARAGLVRAWSSPELISRAFGDVVQIFITPQGSLHVIYTAWDNLETGTKDGNAYYMGSADGSSNFSNPIQLSLITARDETRAAHASLTADENGALHAIWYEASPPEWTGSNISYARSLDNGRTWTSAIHLEEKPADERWASSPEIMNVQDNTLVVVWVCGGVAHRCQTWSYDGGASWSPKERLFGEMISLAGWDSLIKDSDGTIYWILQLRYPEAIYISHWQGAEWSALDVVNDTNLRTGHYVRSTIGLGNQLYLALVDQDIKEVWAIRGQLSAQAIDPVPVQAPAETAKPVSTAVSTVLPTQIARPTLQADILPQEIDPKDPFSQYGFLVTSSLLVIALLALVAILRRWRPF